MKDNGLRLLLVGYESGNQQILHNIKKGMRVDIARALRKDCTNSGSRFTGHSSWGAGETRETIQETIDFARRSTLSYDASQPRGADLRHRGILRASEGKRLALQ